MTCNQCPNDNRVHHLGSHPKPNEFNPNGAPNDNDEMHFSASWIVKVTLDKLPAYYGPFTAPEAQRFARRLNTAWRVTYFPLINPNHPDNKEELGL